jgi:hypothetical protein
MRLAAAIRRRSRADRCRSSTDVESVVACRDQTRRHGNAQRGRRRSLGRRDSIGGSLDGGFHPCLRFPSARAATMAVGAPGSSREMEPPPRFASTPMHPLMPWGQPRSTALNGAPRFAPPSFGQPRARRQPLAPSVPHFPTAAPAPYHPTDAPASPPPPPGFGVRPPRAHVVAGARPPPPSGPLTLYPIVSTLHPFLIGYM